MAAMAVLAAQVRSRPFQPPLRWSLQLAAMGRLEAVLVVLAALAAVCVAAAAVVVAVVSVAQAAQAALAHKAQS